MIKSTATSFEIASAAAVQSLNFNRWLTDFAYGALALKGFFSAEIIPPDLAPTETEQEQKLPAIWSVIHRFDSDEACSAWLNSTERKSQLQRPTWLRVKKIDIFSGSSNLSLLSQAFLDIRRAICKLPCPVGTTTGVVFSTSVAQTP
jgi:hypothetical protein